MKTFNLSLRLLAHPASLASITVLLINDHWLKWAAPSALTGKLSDFAGLFFFPFLVAAGLSLFLPIPLKVAGRAGKRVAPIFGRVSDWAGSDAFWMALAFATSAVWFASVKMLPGVQRVTLTALENLVGVNGQIVMDPSDLIALSSLLPGWALYRRVRQLDGAWKPGKLVYLTLGAASLASLATSAPRIPYVDRVIPHQDQLFARYSDGQALPEPRFQTFASTDGGQTWEEVSDAPQQVVAGLNTEIRLPKQICREQAAQECYRITGQEMVERSTDGGQTWQADWQIPSGRKAYMLRSNLPLSGKNINTIPRDLAVLERGEQVWVVAAMVDEGVLVRTPQGEWQRIALLNAAPTPYKADGPAETIFTLLPENISIMALVYVSLLGLCILGWWVILRRIDLPTRRPASYVLRPMFLSLFIVVLVAVAAAVLNELGFIAKTGSVGDLATLIFTYFLLPATPLYLLIGAWMTWIMVGKVAPDPRAAKRAGWTCILGPLLLALATWLPFVFWALGIIQSHTVALVVAALLGLLILGWAARRVLKLSLQAAGDKALALE